MTKTITAKYTDSVELLTFFATAKGWTEKVFEKQEVTDENEVVTTEQVEIDNPITLEMFLTEFTTALLIKEISEPVERAVKQQSRIEAQTVINVKKAEIEDKLKVTTE